MDWPNFTTWKRKCVAICLLSIFRPANVQFMPPPGMFAMPQPGMYPMAQPAIMMPQPMQIAIMPYEVTTKKSTTTTITTTIKPTITTTSSSKSKDEGDKVDMAFAFPVPMPMPMQIAVPAMPPPAFCMVQPRPVQCPPCPPCLCSPACTPSFFSYCSPCHQKCRCVNPGDAPVPLPPVAPMPASGPAFALPMPQMAPPPAIMVPIPPFPKMPERDRRKDSCSDESKSSSETDSSSSDTDSGSGDCRRSNKKRHQHKFRKFNKRRMRFDKRRPLSDDDLQPVFSFVNKYGDDVEGRRKLTASDEYQLTHDFPQQKQKIPGSVQTVKVMTGEDIRKVPQMVLVSEFDGKHQKRKTLTQGRKELVFKPANDKSIRNLSISFQVS